MGNHYGSYVNGYHAAVMLNRSLIHNTATKKPSVTKECEDFVSIEGGGTITIDDLNAQRAISNWLVMNRHFLQDVTN